VYYEHYRGEGGGFKMIMGTFAGSHKHLVSEKKLGDPKLTRYTPQIFERETNLAVTKSVELLAHSSLL
jgi:hypothetical protein